MRLPARYGSVLATTVGALVLAGCGSDGDGAGSEEATPHGYVEGAEEAAEPQWRLVLADTDSGALRMLDPATEEVTEVGEAPGVREAATDGRFVYLGTGDETTVFDSGTWTVDHGDHVHYYHAEADLLGTTEAAGELRVAGNDEVTALTTDDGDGVHVRLLDRTTMADDGEITEAATVPGAAALALGERLLVAGADDSAGIGVFNGDGEPADAEVTEPCPDPTAQAATRRGAVFGCSDGAVVVSEDDNGGLAAEHIALPDDAEPMRSFDHRPTTPVLVGTSEDDQMWVLDVGEADWTPIDTEEPVLAASAAGEDMPVLALGADGALRSYDPASGEETAETELLDAPGGDTPDPQIWIDTGRAYVNDPEEQAVHEIDYNDDLRLARTFDLDVTPDLMVETGW